jgi:competence protein ComEC
MTKSLVFFWLLVAFIAGIGMASFIPLSLSLVWVFFLFGTALIAYGILIPQSRKYFLVIGFAVVLCSCGMIRFLASNRIPESDLALFVGRDASRQGIVLDEPIRTAGTQRITATLDSGDHILLVAKLYPEYRYGDRIQVQGKLEEPENFSDDFDYRAYLAKDEIYYMMSFPKIEEIASDQGSWVFSKLLSIKHAFAEQLNRTLPEPQASFMAGLILGERRSLPADIVTDFQRTGTSHIVALSGYNITIIGDALMKVLAFFTIPFSWAFAGSVIGILAFTAVTGAQASVVRAAIMGILVLVARRVGRSYHVRNALTLAGALMLLENPKILRFDVGFELSFLATLGLVYGSPILERAYETMKLRFTPPLRDLGLVHEDRNLRAPRRASVIRGVLISTISAQLFVIPLLVYQFGTLSIVSPIANLAVLPFIPATMLFGFFTGMLGFASDLLGQIVGWVSWCFLTYELSAISLFSRVPFAAIQISGIAPAIVSIVYGIGIAIIWKRIRHAR